MDVNKDEWTAKVVEPVRKLHKLDEPIKEAHAVVDGLMHERLRSHGEEDRLAIALVGAHRELGEIMTRISVVVNLIRVIEERAG